MLETKNKEITNKTIKIENLQKEIKSVQHSRIKKSGKNDQLQKEYIEAVTQSKLGSVSKEIHSGLANGRWQRSRPN